MNKTENKKNDELNIDDHLLPIEKLVERYGTDLQSGLSTKKVAKIRKTEGLNQLTSVKQVPEYVKFINRMTGGFSCLLWFGAILCFIAYFLNKSEHTKDKDNLYLGCSLVLVVVITGAFAYYQEAKSSSIMESFKELIPHKAFALRDGVLQEICPKFLVTGDIVEINGGDQVPADIRIFDCLGFKVDNSSITGESDPQLRSTNCTSKNPLETENLAFFSTYCTEGRARGMVIKTGNNTLIGKIANLTQQQSSETSIAKEIKYFIHLITIFAFSLALVFFIASMAIGYTWLDAMVFFIGIIVANVPEGLLATVTVCLSLTANSMYKKNCLVKNLEAVETLGSTSIICSDKTGTLTQNKMKVSHIWFNNEIIEANDLTMHTTMNTSLMKSITQKSNRFHDLLRVCSLCNKAKYKPNQKNAIASKRECLGDASEIALFRFVESMGLDCIRVRQHYPLITEVPFNSTNKFHVTIHSLEEEKVKHKFLVCLKGAPERVLKFCQSILLEGHCKVLNPDTRLILERIFEYLAAKGERVLAFSEFYTDDINSLFEDEAKTKVHLTDKSTFTFLGLMSLIDPARPEVPDAVDKCRMAGIRVFMVTGDHPITAQAIAQHVGIISKQAESTVVMNEHIRENLFSLKENPTDFEFADKAFVVPGDILSLLTKEQLDFLISHVPEIVFARTSPQQKLQIVESCQRLGNIVAVTGDGVNDSPALKRANIGIAMGITGSDVSKEAADMILLDDNFASIVVGIEEGRVIFDNLKKSIAYVLASNFSEIIPFLFYVIFGFPLALGTITILCIDLGTDIFPAVSLAYEKAESDIMKQKPRCAQTDHLVTMNIFNTAYLMTGMIEAAAGFFTYFVVMRDHGFFLNDLFNIRKEWDDKDNIIIDQFGKEWDYANRKVLENKCQTAYFISIVVCQWADLLICKTRRNSLFTQGMSNRVLDTALVFETTLALILCYTPGMKTVFKLYPPKWWYWFTSLPFSIYIFVSDEIRRKFLRCRPEGFFEKETYY